MLNPFMIPVFKPQVVSPDVTTADISLRSWNRSTCNWPKSLISTKAGMLPDIYVLILILKPKWDVFMHCFISLTGMYT